MPKYRVVIERDACIGAATCVVAAPDRWEIQSDAKASLKGSDVKKEGDKEEIWIEEDELAKMKESAEVCPVNVIHIYDEKGNKII